MAMLARRSTPCQMNSPRVMRCWKTRTGEKPRAGAENEILSFLWQANRRLHMQVPLCERLSPVLNGLQNLTCCTIGASGCTTWKMKKITVSLPVSQT